MYVNLVVAEVCSVYIMIFRLWGKAVIITYIIDKNMTHSYCRDSAVQGNRFWHQSK